MGAKDDPPKDDPPGAGGQEQGRRGEKPLLMVDIDGVISLFGFPGGPPWRGWHGAEGATPAGIGEGNGGAGSVHAIDGVPHFLSREAATHLLELERDFELVWASGWEEKADEYLPYLLGLPRGLPHLRFERDGMARAANAHWKLTAIEAHAGARALAWIDEVRPRCSWRRPPSEA